MPENQWHHPCMIFKVLATMSTLYQCLPVTDLPIFEIHNKFCGFANTEELFVAEFCINKH
jgi:hypothetical protein